MTKATCDGYCGCGTYWPAAVAAIGRCPKCDFDRHGPQSARPSHTVIDRDDNRYTCHTMSDGRKIYHHERLVVKCPYGGSEVREGTATFQSSTYRPGTILVFTDRYGNTHCPQDAAVVAIGL